ncbi:hypothetical protein J6590_100000 [Homalodisca vitripennis]|nr:hypothetical protein J6590_100000 [Homalodisca vitripennis]
MRVNQVGFQVTQYARSPAPDRRATSVLLLLVGGFIMSPPVGMPRKRNMTVFRTNQGVPNRKRITL